MSSIPVLTKPDVEQLHCCDQCHYHYAKPPPMHNNAHTTCNICISKHINLNSAINSMLKSFYSYSRYLVACIRLISLWVVCTKCYRETVKQLGQRTDYELICHVRGLVICVILFLCCLCFLKIQISVQLCVLLFVLLYVWLASGVIYDIKK